MQRAVQRGPSQRGDLAPTRIGIDETSFQKRHEYVTVVTDQTTGHALHVADNRTKESLDLVGHPLSPRAAETRRSHDPRTF